MSITTANLLRQQPKLGAGEDEAFLTHKPEVAEAWADAYMGAALVAPVPAPSPRPSSNSPRTGSSSARPR